MRRSNSWVVVGGLLVAGGASADELDLAHAAFAEELVQYEPTLQGAAPTDPRVRKGEAALGPPARKLGTSLGRGGLLEVGFGRVVATNSGDGRPDLVIVEVGGDIEASHVAVLPADEETARRVADRCRDKAEPRHDGYCEVGRVEGGTRGVDLDAAFPGLPAGVLRFSAVQLVDDSAQGQRAGRSVGADIAAVAALFYAPVTREERSFFAPALPAAPRTPTLPRTLPASTPDRAPVASGGVPANPGASPAGLPVLPTPTLPSAVPAIPAVGVEVPAAPAVNLTTPTTGTVPRP